MKKKFLSSIALLTMAVASCTENIVPTEVVKPETKLKNRAIEDIIRIAQNAPSLFDGEDGTRGTTKASKEIDLSSITSITNKGMTRTSGAIDTLLYVMNYADNEGYVIISSKQGTPGVIAYIEEGQYDMSEIEDKESDIGYVTKLASEYITTQNTIYEPLPFVKDDTLAFKIGPFLQTAWGRNEPEGIFCPNGDAGCANTAMAQIMAYYEYPDTLQLNYEEADRDYQILNWENIKQHKVRHSISGLNGLNLCMMGDETHNAIARLCREIGDMNLSDYWIEDQGTGTSESDMLNTARVLGFNVEPWKWYNDTCLIEPLSSGHPVVVSGKKEGNFKHMWVVDGYMKLNITSYAFVEIGMTGPVTYEELYNHVNWGWDGRSNGYFLSNIFNVGRRFQADPSKWGPTHTSDVYDTALQYFEFYRPIDPFIPF